MAKFYYCELIFNYIIRKFIIKYNNILNIRTIVNLNLFQRRLYLLEIKNFYKINPKNSNGNDSILNEKLVNQMINNFLELFESILKYVDTGDDPQNVIGSFYSYYFTTFNRFFKYLIKFNLLSENQTNKYYELVFDALKIFNDKINKKDSEEQIETVESNKKEDQNSPKNEKNNNISNSSRVTDVDIKKKMNIREPTKNNTLKSSYYIMKSLFYSLLYHNDKICIKYFKGDYNKLKDKFVFIQNDFTEELSKVFF